MPNAAADGRADVLMQPPNYTDILSLIRFRPSKSTGIGRNWRGGIPHALSPLAAPKTQAAGRSAKAREHRSKAGDSRIQAKVFQELAVLKGLRRNPNCFLLRFALTPPLGPRHVRRCAPPAANSLPCLPTEQRRRTRLAAGSTPNEAKSTLLSASGLRRKALAVTPCPRVVELQAAVRFEGASMPTSLSIPTPLRPDQLPLCHELREHVKNK